MGEIVGRAGHDADIAVAHGSCPYGCWANLMLCLDIQMANIISLYLMLFTQLSASGGYEKFVKSED
ncbi:TPA: hypothetical protein NPN46_002615 [Klebsiella pneumoniae]|uniref:Uncharacterized protein n=2 Tax=Klebsiella pneumoniae TaxID=573 RepID=A0A919LSZ2_KLEPN|nr:hypothetical protein KPZU09_30900 [Klebsiella pneumoniae]HCI5904531.1 hypothetical protein [Klebsiella pneumoniae]